MNFHYLNHLISNNSEAMMQLGTLMRKGTPMAESFYRISQTAKSQRMRAMATLAARRLSSGEGSDKVFSAGDMAIFPPAVRYILAAPLKDEVRGMLIADLQARPATGFRLEAALFYPVMSLGIGMMTALSLYMFVIPQMREIFLGMHIESGPFIGWLFDICGEGSILYLLLTMVIFAVIIQLVIFVSRRLTDFSKKIDEMNLLRMLAAVPLEERVAVTDVMAVKHNFPAQHANFRRLARALIDGRDVVGASRDAGISDALTWFVALGLQDKNAESRLLQQASEYFNAGIEQANDRTVTLIEVASTLFLSTVFGSLAVALLQMMNAICEGILK